MDDNEPPLCILGWYDVHTCSLAIPIINVILNILVFAYTFDCVFKISTGTILLNIKLRICDIPAINWPYLYSILIITPVLVILNIRLRSALLNHKFGPIRHWYWANAILLFLHLLHFIFAVVVNLHSYKYAYHEVSSESNERDIYTIGLIVQNVYTGLQFFWTAGTMFTIYEYCEYEKRRTAQNAIPLQS